MMEKWSEPQTGISRFNLRAYGLVTSDQQQVLICEELMRGYRFTKFPGGGLEYGEGIHDCLRREFREELNTEIEVMGHFYTTDFFQRSAFVDTDQLISIYYRVKLLHPITQYEVDLNGHLLRFFWHPLQALNAEMLTFRIDKKVALLLREEHLQQTIQP